jgi:putative oxidoreductase
MKSAVKNLFFGGAGSASRAGDVGLLVLRLVGLLMAIGHGMSKLIGEGRFGPPEQLVAGVEKMGFPMPTAFAWAAALAEFVGGILIALGLLTRPAALALAFNMAVAAFVAHGGDPLFMGGKGAAKEPALLYLIPFAALALTGAGRYSIDRFIAARPRNGQHGIDTK